MQVLLELTDTEVRLLEHYVPDVKEWLDGMITGKLNSCKKRLVTAEFNKALQEGTSLSATPDAIVDNCLSAPGYKNRKQRDEEAKQRGNPKTPV